MGFFANILFYALLSCSHANDDQLIINKLGDNIGFEFKFEQKNFYKFLKAPKITTGKALFSNPSSFVWEVAGDNAVKIVSNGKRTWIYSPPEEEGDTPSLAVRDGSFGDGIQSLILGSKYKVCDLKQAKGKKGFKELRVKGSKDKGYIWATITFADGSDFRLDSVEFEDKDGSKVLIQVRDFKRLSKKVAAKTFVFKAPKGTRIIQ